MEAGNRFGATIRIARTVWRDITLVAAMGREEKDRRRALRVKVCGVRTFVSLFRFSMLCFHTACYGGGIGVQVGAGPILSESSSPEMKVFVFRPFRPHCT